MRPRGFFQRVFLHVISPGDDFILVACDFKPKESEKGHKVLNMEISLHKESPPLSLLLEAHDGDIGEPDLVDGGKHAQ